MKHGEHMSVSDHALVNELEVLAHKSRRDWEDGQRPQEKAEEEITRARLEKLRLLPSLVEREEREEAA